MKHQFENMAIIIGNHSVKHSTVEILKYSSVVSILNFMYNCFVLEGIDTIENIDRQLKIKFFEISCKYYNTTEERIKASKAAYTLSLITSSE